MTPKIPYTKGATVWKKNPPVLGSIYALADEMYVKNIIIAKKRIDGALIFFTLL